MGALNIRVGRMAFALTQSGEWGFMTPVMLGGETPMDIEIWVIGLNWSVSL